MSEATRVPYRGLITASAMLAMLMQTLDSTIANVALPYMQGSMSASSDEITWVLTSYVIAAAIFTAPVGWMAVRFGRKKLFITCVAGFTVASMMCGAAQSLEQLVAFRLLQGMCGAAIAPLSQATMLDIYPFSRRAQAMAIFSMGVTMGPIMGPTLGGYLTDAYSWRWVFYVNLPFGILAITGLALFMPSAPARPHLKFSWYGFAMLALGAGALQMMLDRGQELDWFSSREIIVEATLAGLGFYLFIVHMFTADKPFLSPGLFKDRNFLRRHGHGVFYFLGDAGHLGIARALFAAIWRAIRFTRPVGQWRRAGWAPSPRCSWPAGLVCDSISARSWQWDC